MSQPGRTVIDLQGIRENRVPARIEVEDFGILRIRSGMFRVDTARALLDCSAQVLEHRIEARADGLAVIFTKAPSTDADKAPAAAGPVNALGKLEENVEEVKTTVRDSSNKLDQARPQLVFDFYVHSRTCTIQVEHFDLKIGGFFLGAGLGFEF